jgi:undecaprenyl-diphosphatase
MDIVVLLKALIMGVVEGLTEFLPISSTGHLIIVGQLLGFNDDKAKVFDIVIQSGAMLAIVWEYRARFASVLARLPTDPAARRFVTNLIVAFIPAGAVGFLFNNAIKAHLFFAVPVAIAFIVGGLIILWVDRRAAHARVANVDDMSWSDSLKVGIAQCVALVPGASRSGSTIIGGMLFGLSRRAATEFSFFLAVPTLFAAGGYSFYKERALFHAADFAPLAVGFVTSFVSAFLCVRWLLRYIATHDFTLFAWYRIAFGLMVLATAYSGVIDWTG